ncbi:hypothetical protein AB0J30_14970 [Streptomyces microflavus]|uniref:hypothetical protein n=1 Tax=Streptomyces microflavus TaxID=1919 RepID=UPI0034310622
MPVWAGQIVTAGLFNRLQPRKHLAEASGSLTATTVYQPIPGCSLVAPSTMAGAAWSALGIFDCNVSTIHATNLMVGRLTVDGTSQSGLAIHAMDTADRDTVAMVWGGTLAAIGNHTFTMEGVINGASGAGGFFAYSRLEVTITEPV